jgi:hypothetical protein
MPVARETLRLAFVIPTARLQLKPPLFIISLPCRTQQGHLYGSATDRSCSSTWRRDMALLPVAVVTLLP